MPSQAMIQAGKEQTRQNLYGHFVRLSAEVETLKAKQTTKSKPVRRSRAKPKK